MVPRCWLMCWKVACRISSTVRSLVSESFLEYGATAVGRVFSLLGDCSPPVPLLWPPLEGPQKHFCVLNPKPFLKPKAPTPPQNAAGAQSAPHPEGSAPPLPPHHPGHSHPAHSAVRCPHSPLFENKPHTKDANAYPDKRVSRWKEKAPGIPLPFYSP